MAYRKIDPRMWDDDRFAELHPETKLLWVCILTGPHTTSLPGLWVCGIATLAETTRLPSETVSERLGELSSKGLVDFDARHRILRVPNAPRYNPPDNPNVLTGWWNLWRSLFDCPAKYRHIPALKGAIDPDNEKLQAVWKATFETVKPKPFPDGYETVPDSGAGAGAGTRTTVPPSGGAPGKASPAKPRKRATQPVLPGAEPEPDKDPMPFSVGDLFGMLRSDRFVAGRLDKGIGAAVTARIKANPDPKHWQALAAWWKAGGGGYRTDPYSPSFIASSALNDAMAAALAWDAAGRKPLNGKASSAKPGPAPVSQTFDDDGPDPLEEMLAVRKAQTERELAADAARGG